MWNKVLIPAFLPPTIIVTQRVIHNMIAASAHEAVFSNDDHETGEAMFGLVIEPSTQAPWQEPSFVVMGTIPSSSTIRRAAMVELGGQDQVDIFNWYDQYWEMTRENSRNSTTYTDHVWGSPIPLGIIPAAFDLPLQDVGDWHRHPGSMAQPSAGDLRTAIATLTDVQLNIRHLIAPIVTVERRRGAKFEWAGMALSQDPPDYSVRINFYYISRKMLQRGMRSFIPVQPVIIEDDKAPALPTLSWSLEDPTRLQQEKALLEAYGCQVRVVVREMNGTPPMEVCIAIRHPDWADTVLVVTSADYPLTPPEFRVIAPEGESSVVLVPTIEREPEKPGIFTQFLSRFSKANSTVSANTQILNQPRAVGNETGPWQQTDYILTGVMRLWSSGAIKGKSSEAIHEGDQNV